MHPDPKKGNRIAIPLRLPDQYEGSNHWENWRHHNSSLQWFGFPIPYDYEKSQRLCNKIWFLEWEKKAPIIISISIGLVMFHLWPKEAGMSVSSVFILLQDKGLMIQNASRGSVGTYGRVWADSPCAYSKITVIPLIFKALTRKSKDSFAHFWYIIYFTEQLQ